ncbi:MAG: Rpn family recombination-promoting nuclease/putative transposase [Planctomycetes bacterium]|nr:Rpn family recombination-promoting nuclease/putative transposase [Planctomycetota bacterium]
MGTPHDSLFHFTFRHADHAAAWLRSVLPACVVAALQWSTLRALPERLHGKALRFHVTDAVFTIKFVAVRGRAFLLLEHRSHADEALAGTVVRYSVHLAHSLRRDRSSPPLPVVPVVLYHGPGPFEPVAPASPLAGIDPAASATLLRLQPTQELIVDDLTIETEAGLLARPMTPLGMLTVLALRFLPGASPAEAVAAIDRWGPLLRAVDDAPGPPVGREAIEQFGWYVLHVTDAEPVDVHMAIQKHLQRPEEKIMTTAQRLRNEGLKEGRAATLLHLLTRRFGALPAAVEARLRNASTELLERWTDRVLDAPALDAVFAED